MLWLRGASSYSRVLLWEVPNMRGQTGSGGVKSCFCQSKFSIQIYYIRPKWKELCPLYFHKDPQLQSSGINSPRPWHRTKNRISICWHAIGNTDKLLTFNHLHQTICGTQEHLRIFGLPNNKDTPPPMQNHEPPGDNVVYTDRSCLNNKSKSWIWHLVQLKWPTEHKQCCKYWPSLPSQLYTRAYREVLFGLLIGPKGPVWQWTS